MKGHGKDYSKQKYTVFDLISPPGGSEIWGQRGFLELLEHKILLESHVGYLGPFVIY